MPCMGGPIGLDSSDDDAGVLRSCRKCHALPGCCGGVLLGRDPRQPASTQALTAAATIPGRAGAREGATARRVAVEERTGERIEACRGSKPAVDGDRSLPGIEAGVSWSVWELGKRLGSLLEKRFRNRYATFRLSLGKVFQCSTRDSHRPKFET